jgi:hypothetical protein
MLTPYQKSFSAVKYSDTATMLSPYYNKTATDARLALKVNFTDTATMLTPYQKSFSAVKYSDTAMMLSKYPNLTYFSSKMAQYVPYIGATGAVDLGTNKFSSGSATIDGMLYNSYKGAGADGGNIFIGGGGQVSSIGTSAWEGSYNTALGMSTLQSNTTGYGSTAIGNYTLANNTTGRHNTVLGSNSGNGITSGLANTIIGANIDIGDVSSYIAIGDGNGLVKMLHDGTSWNITDATTFSSSVNASSFIKSGGTSSQFLKADGSISTGTLGVTTNALTLGNGLLSTTFNGSAAITAKVDTATIATRLRVQKGVDSLGDLKLNISDTTSMLSNYYNKTASDSKFLPLIGGTLTNTLTGTNIVATGDVFVSQTNPIALTGGGTMSISQLLANIITVTSATAVNLTLPTGTLTDAGILAGALPVNGSFDWSIINLGSSVGAVTIVAGTGHTLIGSATVGITTSAMFRTRKTAANTFVTYRIS